jgi:DNA-binding transcriptional regulator GbsR (MarR family)
MPHTKQSKSTVRKAPEDTDSKTISYPEGETHGVTIYVQLNDNNRLYDRLTDAQRELNNERGTNADSDNPHDLGEIDSPWTEGTDEIGFFSTRVEYGEMGNSGFTQYYAQVLNLYEDVQESKIANNPAKRRVEIHKRSDELCYEDGNDYTWPEGWDTGERHEGTCLKIQASYVDHYSEAIGHAFELIEATDLLSKYELRQAKDPIAETIRFSGLESHHRIHNNHEKDAIDTLRDSARLVSTEGDGKEKATIEKGHHQIYAFRNDRIDFLGFDTSIEWEYKGKDYTDTVDQHYMKVYRHSSADQFANTDARAHPKIEIKADGTYPAPAWDAVKHQLDTILNAHTSDFAGIRPTGLIEDKYHDGSDQDYVVTESPSDYRINLQEYFKSTGLKKEIISLIVNNRSKSAKDILYTLIRLGRPTPYSELTEETGLTKRTIRKWVRKLEDLDVVERKMDAEMYVCMTDFVREHLRGFIDKTIPVGDTKREIERRKRERIEAREGTDSATDNSQAIATDGGTNRPQTEQTSTDHASTLSEKTQTPTTDRPPD